MSRSRSPVAVSVLLAAGLLACGEQEGDPLVARGRAVYLGACVACHAMDPSQEGGVGPAIAGSSKELLEARLLRGEYPPGYTPKRTTGAMPLFQNLAPEIDALTAFLAVPAESSPPAGG